MRLTTFATVAAASGVTLAQSNSWSSWSASQSVTTTVTLTLLHVSNQTVTSTSYTHSATGVPHIQANATSTYESYTMSTPTGSATIAAFSSGAAVAPQANIAVAGLLGFGAVAYALY